MPVTQVKPYEAIDFSHLKGLEGISDKQLEVHFKLYQGYVVNTNKLNELVGELSAAGKAGTPEYSELKRRFGFEYDGMRLHEYYFGGLKPNGGALPQGGKLARKLEEDFGSVEAWEKDFRGTATMRGIGWVILYQDNHTGRLQNFWVSDHELGHPAGFLPILVMDMWEHAFMVDYVPAEKGTYVDAFFKNIDWQAVESRLR